jgi:hypothetical protein
MRWSTVTHVGTDDEFFKDYLATALNTTPPPLPPRQQRIGAVDVQWHECEPGIAFIHTEGGTVDDRIFARMLVTAQLKGHAFKQAQFTFDADDELRKTAGWTDIMSKAKRLIQSGQVQLLRNGANNIVAQVQGDHGSYQVEISRDDPSSRAITQWTCDCPWDQYAWQRTRQWKKYEGRPCAHTLAAYWLSLSTPLDEDIHPAQQATPGQQPGGQMSLFNAPPRAPQMMQPGMAPGMMPNQMQAPPEMAQQMAIPGVSPMMAQGTPPMDPGIIPPWPMQQVQQEQPVVSIPDAKQPSPMNPIQNRNTFSSVQDGWHFAAPQGFTNGMMVQTLHDDMGIWEGRSAEHGAGEYTNIPAGSIGEVLGQDPTGLVNVLFMNEAIGVQKHGPMMPWGATGWFMPSELRLRADVRAPGPAVKRRT